MAAQHGLVVMETGSYVSNPAATRATLDGGGGVTIVVQGNIYGDRHFRDTIEIVAREMLAAAAPIGVRNRRIELGMR